MAPGHPNRLGVVTSRKVGSAVIRNRARRLLREAFRRHQHALKGPLDVVLVARASIAGKRAGEVEQDFLVALRRRALLRSAA
jgi:ribonuclease P protein component